MAQCEKCRTQIPNSANFCPNCGVPRNRDAFERFDTYARRHLGTASDGHARSIDQPSGDRSLFDRLSYVLGWSGVLLGLAMVPDLGGMFVLGGGISILPPVRAFVERSLDRPVGILPTMGTWIGLVAIGLTLLWIV